MFIFCFITHWQFIIMSFFIDFFYVLLERIKRDANKGKNVYIFWNKAFGGNDFWGGMLCGFIYRPQTVGA